MSKEGLIASPNGIQEKLLQDDEGGEMQQDEDGELYNKKILSLELDSKKFVEAGTSKWWNWVWLLAALTEEEMKKMVQQYIQKEAK